MSPLTNNLDTIDTESDGQLEPRMSDMRRVSLSLAFSPARHRRRKHMNSVNGWLKNKLGINSRRASRVN
jgi:hypothetical protein